MKDAVKLAWQCPLFSRLYYSVIKKVKLDTPVTNQMTSHSYCINVKSVLSRQQSKCLNELGNIVKSCANKDNDSDIKEIIDSQVKVCWEEWLEDTNTLINTVNLRLFVL